MSRRLHGLACLGTLSLCLCAPARAHLGGDVASVQLDSQVMHAPLRSTATQQYDLHEIASGPNVMVREYVAPSGKVFAVTWQAPVMPNLRQLLGNYFDTYVAAASATPRPGGHRHVAVVRDDLVVYSAGHVRAFHGKAYIPALLPAGVSIADLP
jgi:hypothetical protein